jgi:GxxExxY protein
MIELNPCTDRIIGAAIEVHKTLLIVAGSVVVEIKSASTIEPIHEAPLLTYSRLGWKLGLLMNFNVAVLKDGIRRRSL